METKTEKEVFAPGCEHHCTGNCRRVGCNCECGEWHGKYEPEEIIMPYKPEVKKENVVWYVVFGVAFLGVLFLWGFAF